MRMFTCSVWVTYIHANVLIRWNWINELALKLLLGNWVTVVQKNKDTQSNSQQNLPPLIWEPYFWELLMKWIKAWPWCNNISHATYPLKVKVREGSRLAHKKSEMICHRRGTAQGSLILLFAQVTIKPHHDICKLEWEKSLAEGINRFQGCLKNSHRDANPTKWNAALSAGCDWVWMGTDCFFLWSKVTDEVLISLQHLLTIVQCVNFLLVISFSLLVVLGCNRWECILPPFKSTIVDLFHLQPQLCP